MGGGELAQSDWRREDQALYRQQGSPQTPADSGGVRLDTMGAREPSTTIGMPDDDPVLQFYLVNGQPSALPILIAVNAPSDHVHRDNRSSQSHVPCCALARRCLTLLT